MKIKNFIVAIMAVTLFLACATNPFTGKSTLALPGTENSSLFPTSFQQYDTFLSENKVIKGTAQAEMVARVGERIALAAEKWLNANGYAGYLNDYKWDYNLVDDAAVNAWCMPGGKIVVYTGILPIAQNETALAVVMGHEVAHALANHGQQRMSAGTLQQLGAVGLNVALQNDKNLDMYNQAYGIGSNVLGMLPFSRKHETEADKIGIVLTAIAGYNPDEAPRLWQRMSQNSGGEAPPEFMSTHPSNESRIANLTALAKTAKEEAAKFGVTSFRPITNFK